MPNKYVHLICAGQCEALIAWFLGLVFVDEILILRVSKLLLVPQL